ncbi:MAG: hypothetical protein KDN05_19310, partial [Verrucomicrobiae bacterium]|nr:hypothetical protein [Verrucomicrobiae bacterium]
MKCLAIGTAVVSLLSSAAASPTCDADHDHVHAADEADAFGRFNDWSVGGFLFAGLNLQGIGGLVDGDPEELAVGAHDPKRERFSAQTIEPTLLLRGGPVEVFSNAVLGQDADGGWDAEMEEYHATFFHDGFRLKGGSFLAENGLHGALHAHGLDWVNAPLASSVFLGEHGLLLRGAEISWEPEQVPLRFVAGLGRADTHDHEEHGDEHEDEHEEEHGHEHEHDHADWHEAEFASTVVNLRSTGTWRAGSGNRFLAGTSLATGRNGFGHETTVLGADFRWSRKPAGADHEWSWNSEILWRRVGTGGGSGIDWGAGSELTLRWREMWH